MKNQWLFNDFSLLGSLSGVLWSVLMASWGVLGAGLAVLGSSWASWAVLEAPWGPLGPSWEPLGALLARLGAFLGPKKSREKLREAPGVEASTCHMPLKTKLSWGRAGEFAGRERGKKTRATHLEHKAGKKQASAS